MDDATYYSERERVERCLAANASDPAARSIHLELAGNYRKRAANARMKAEGASEPAFIAGAGPAAEGTRRIMASVPRRYQGG